MKTWMRQTGCVAATALAAAIMCAPILAQDTPPPPPPAGQGGPPPGGGMRGGGMNPERRLEMMQKELSLTPDQTTQVKGIFADSRTKMEALRSNTGLSQDDRRTQMMGIRKDENGKIEALLTPDQKTKYKAMQEQMRERRGPDGQGPPPPPPPPPNPQ
jgi:periplasmic protein CpxP/Spy